MHLSSAFSTGFNSLPRPHSSGSLSQLETSLNVWRVQHLSGCGFGYAPRLEETDQQSVKHSVKCELGEWRIIWGVMGWGLGNIVLVSSEVLQSNLMTTYCPSQKSDLQFHLLWFISMVYEEVTADAA